MIWTNQPITYQLIAKTQLDQKILMHNWIFYSTRLTLVQWVAPQKRILFQLTWLAVWRLLRECLLANIHVFFTYLWLLCEHIFRFGEWLLTHCNSYSYCHLALFKKPCVVLFMVMFKLPGFILKAFYSAFAGKRPGKLHFHPRHLFQLLALCK